MTAKNQRLWLVVLALVAVGAAALLALSALKDQAAYFYAPSDIVRDGVPVGRKMRLGGMVQRGSVRRDADGVTTRFAVTDNLQSVEVTYRGVLPDLFHEGSGVVADGALVRPGLFVAATILAKHDEKYMPPQVAGAMHETKSLK